MRGARVDALRLVGEDRPDELLPEQLLNGLARKGAIAPARGQGGATGVGHGTMFIRLGDWWAQCNECKARAACTRR